VQNFVPLQFFDFLYILCGATGVALLIQVVYGFAYLLSKLQINVGFVRVFINAVNQLAVIVKVGALLVVRIFMLPLWLGK
jgi:hypothetical protein